MPTLTMEIGEWSDAKMQTMKDSCFFVARPLLLNGAHGPRTKGPNCSTQTSVIQSWGEK